VWRRVVYRKYGHPISDYCSCLWGSNRRQTFPLKSLNSNFATRPHTPGDNLIKFLHRGLQFYASLPTYRLSNAAFSRITKILHLPPSFVSTDTTFFVADVSVTIVPEVPDTLLSFIFTLLFNPLTPNDHYSGRTAPLTSERCILYIYSTNICIEYFKNGIYSPFFSLQNAVCFIIITYLVPVLFKFCILVC
jgi:hypothetical protein